MQNPSKGSGNIEPQMAISCQHLKLPVKELSWFNRVVGQKGIMENFKLSRLFLRRSWLFSINWPWGRLLRTVPTQFIENGDTELVRTWSLQPYILVSLVWEGTMLATKGVTWTQTQPQNLWPKIYLAWKICQCSGGTELEVIAKQCLIWLNTYSITQNSCPGLLW